MSKHGRLILAAVAAFAMAAAGSGGGPLLCAADIPGAAAPALAAEQAPARNLKDLRVEKDDLGRLAVSLLGDGSITYRTELVENPARLVVDLPGVVSRLDRHQFPVGEGGVLRVRAGQYRTKPEPISRVVFDLERAVPYEIAREGSNLVVRFGSQEADRPEGGEQASTLPHSPDNEPAREPLGSAAAAAPAVADASPEASSPAAESAGIPLEAADPPPAGASAPAPSLATAALPPEEIDRILRLPAFAQAGSGSEPGSAAAGGPSFETRRIVTEATRYTGKRISLNLVDADIKQVFRLFHEISGINFVLDPSVEGRVTIVLDEVPWDQALDIILKNNGLDKVYENNVIRIATTAKLAQEAAARKQLKEAKELEAEPVTITRTLSYAKAKDVERVVRDSGVLSARGKVFTDERTNTLIVSDIPKKIEPLDALLSSLDTETPQVMIEARIVETSRQFVQDFGVVWGLNAFADAAHGTATRLNFPHNASVRYGLNLPGAGQASSLAFHFGNILDSLTLDVALNALETEGRGRILSSPKITAQNNERAEIEQGVRIPVVNTTATEINVEFVSASLRLQVTPQITAEGTVVLDIQVENNTPDFVNRVGDVPPINTQRAQTKVLINDGGTAVIGGIFSVNEGTSETGVPWFRKIPVLGWLFKSRNITNENRELLIFITPKIIKLG